jgi:hypothetical protein
MHPLHLEFAFAVLAILIGITPYSTWIQTPFSVLVTQNPDKSSDKGPPPGPYAPEDITSAEFLVLNRDETEYVYETQFTLPKTPGIVSISLPLSAKTSLETGKFYHWYLTLKCKGSTSNTPDIEMDGWVQRTLHKPSTTNQIDTAAPEGWYDAVNNLANRLIASPQDTKLKQEWTDLLKSVGLENLAQEPLIGSVQISQQSLNHYLLLIN